MEGVSLGSAFLRLYGDRSALDRELAVLKRYTDQLEKQGITVKFDADTGRATREVDALQNRLNGLNGILRQVGQGLQGGGWDQLGDSLGKLTGGAAAGSGAMGKFSGALGGALGMAGKALPVLGELGLAAQGLQAIFYGVSAAVNSVLQPMQQLAQEAGRFNQQVAEASIFTAESFAVLGPDGKAIEGTANQMRALRGTIAKEYKEIQKEVAQISGATASEIYEGFNLILQNSSALGKDGEDLSKIRKLSTRLAAGMNTLGIPGDQLRSEVTSLMTGDIQMYDQLPKKLGYDRATVEKLKAEGRFYDDLMQKLEKLYDGQKVLSESLSNVQSNFQDVFQTISSEGGQALERGLAGALKSVLVPLDQLQGSFMGLLRGISEAMEPIQRLFGELGGWLVSIGSMVASTGQVIADVMAVVFNLVGAGLMPILKTIGNTLVVVAKGFQLVATVVSSLLRPLNVFLRVFSRQNTQQIDGFFDGIVGLFDKVIELADKAASVVARPFIEIAKWQAWTQGKLSGQSDEQIAQRQSEIESEFAKSLGGGDAPELRSLKLKESTTRLLEERAARYGNSASSKQLATQKEISQLVQDRIKNEVQALEQGLKLMQAQKSVQEALNQLAEGRRGMEMARAGFSVQLASSPEARLAADERKNDLQQQQEQQRISERRALLGTEREMLQTQLKIQLRQQQLQQEQLKIQRLEIQIQRDKARSALADIRSRMSVLNQGSAEFKSLNRQWNEALQEIALREDQLKIVDRTVQLGQQQVSTIRQTNALEEQRLDIQGQQLDVQLDMANLTREQQATMARIQREEQRITNELESQLNVYRQMEKEDAAEIRRLEEVAKRNQQLLEIEQARTEVKKNQVAAAEQLAEQELKVAQAQANAAENPTSVRAVIGAQIEALAASTTGLVSEADATRQLYAAKERQLQLEQEAQRTQQRLQQERELSEQRILALRLRASLIEAKTTELRLQAEQQRNALQLERDQLAGAVGVTPGAIPGAPSAPVLPGPGRGAARGTLSVGTIKGLAKAAGFNDRDAAIMAAIALAESSGSTSALNDNPKTGDLSYGLWQINMIGRMGPERRRQFGIGSNESLYYPEINAFAAKQIYESQGFSAWSVYRSGAYRSYLPQAMQAPAVDPSNIVGATAPSVQNAINANRISLQENTRQQQEIGQALKDLTERFIPELLERQGLQRQALSQSQASQRRSLQVESNRAILTAEVLNTSRGRLAGQLTEAVVSGLSGTVRGIFAQLRNGRFDLASLGEEISLAMTERVTEALLNAVMSPIEKQLTEGIFKTISGVDVEAAARELTARQEAAAAQQNQASQIQLQAAETMRGIAMGVAPGSTVAGSGPSAGGAIAPPVQAFTGEDSAALGQKFQQTIEGLDVWNTQLPYLQEYTGALASTTSMVQQNLQTVGAKANQATTGFDGLMKGMGGAIAALGSIAMAAGGMQQMGKGGTYNTLMGLASIFGAAGSVVGMFGTGGIFAGKAGGGTSLGQASQGLNFNPQAFSMPLLAGRARGGPVLASNPYVIGENGPELFIPSQSGTVIPNDRLSPYSASQAYLEQRGRASAMATQPAPIDVRFETTRIAGVDYVTADEFRAGMKQAAEQGRSLAMSSLQNSVHARKKVGLA